MALVNCNRCGETTPEGVDPCRFCNSNPEPVYKPESEEPQKPSVVQFYVSLHYDPFSGEHVSYLGDITRRVALYSSTSKLEVLKQSIEILKGNLQHLEVLQKEAEQEEREKEDEGKVLIWSNTKKKWWGPNGNSYVSNTRDAGRFEMEEALQAVRDVDELTDKGGPYETIYPIKRSQR